MTYQTLGGSVVISSGSLSMMPPQGPFFAGVLGPLAQNQASGVVGTIARVTITATDSAGQQASTTVDVTVQRCTQ